MPRYVQWICYKHRHTSKRSGLCPTCRNQLKCIGDRNPIPRKGDNAGWKELYEQVKKTRGYDLIMNESIRSSSVIQQLQVIESDRIGKIKK